MEFFNSAVDVLKTLVVALGAGLGVWGAVNLMEGYGGDNPSAKKSGYEAAHGWRRRCSGGHHPDSSAVRSFRLIEPQAGFPACTYAIAPSLLWITALYNKERIAPNIHLITERECFLCSF